MSIIAIDFDGTCVTHEFPKVGKDIGAESVLKELIDNGHKLVLDTMRSKNVLPDALNWFKDKGIKLYGVNYTPGQKNWTDSSKVYAHLSIDDTNLGCPLIYNSEYSKRPYVNWNEVRNKLIELGYIKISFKNYYKFPLRLLNSLMINDSESHRAIDFLVRFNKDEDKDLEIKEKIIGIVNGVIKNDRIRSCTYDNCEIYINNKPIMRIRGWGYLTGIGSLNLNSEVAASIQDEFGRYICDKLNKIED